MTERLHENELKAEELTRNWTSKWKESHKIIEVGKFVSYGLCVAFQIESLRSTTRPAQRRALETKKFAKQNKNYE